MADAAPKSAPVDEAPSAVKVRSAGIVVFMLLFTSLIVFASLRTGNKVAIPTPSVPQANQHREQAKPFEPDNGMLFGPAAAGSGSAAADGSGPASGDAAGGLDFDQIIAAMDRANHPGAASAASASGPYASAGPAADADIGGPVEIEDEIGGSVPVAAAVAAPGDGATPASSPDTLPPGTVIRGALSQAASSDAPDSPLLALVVRDVLHRDGRIAIPKGSRIMASVKIHSGPNAAIYDRLPTSVQAIVLPDGRVLHLAAPGLDATGVGGLAGDRNRHLLAQAVGVMAYALIGAANATATSSDPLNSQDQMSRDAVSGAGQQVSPLADRYLSVQDTVTSPVTTPITIILTEPLPLS